MDFDVYSPFFHALGAPEWHGRNLDALADSISCGSINHVEVPYRLAFKSYDRIGPHAKAMTDRFINLVHELTTCGLPGGDSRRRSVSEIARFRQLSRAGFATIHSTCHSSAPVSNDCRTRGNGYGAGP